METSSTLGTGVKKSCGLVDEILFSFHVLALLYIFSVDVVVDVVSLRLCPKWAACGPTGSTQLNSTKNFLGT